MGDLIYGRKIVYREALSIIYVFSLLKICPTTLYLGFPEEKYGILTDFT